jgi:hypothetical protein
MFSNLKYVFYIVCSCVNVMMHAKRDLICKNNRLNKKRLGRTQTNSYDKIIRKFGIKQYINLNVMIILKHVDRNVFVATNLV